MKMKVTLKELLIMLDIILFAHVRFHRAEYSALLGTDDESRRVLSEKINNYITDILSDNKKTYKIDFTDADLINLIGFCNHFEFYEEYEKRGRFNRNDIKTLKERL